MINHEKTFIFKIDKAIIEEYETEDLIFLHNWITQEINKRIEKKKKELRK